MMAYLQVANSRGGKALILDEFRYLRNKVKINENKIYWRCARTGCNVWIHTRWLDVSEADPAIVITRPPGNHDHAGEPDLIATTALIQQMLRQVEADPTVPVKRVYDLIVAQTADIRHIPPWDAVKSRLERARARLMPPIPHRVEDVAVADEWALTWRGDDFLTKHNRPHGYLVFGTEENFDKLSQCRQVRTSQMKCSLII